MGKYYIRMDGDVFGPYTAKGMMELDLTPDIMVTEESIDIWQPANKFDFFQLAKQEVLEKLKRTPTNEAIDAVPTIEQKREQLKARLKNNGHLCPPNMGSNNAKNEIGFCSSPTMMNLFPKSIEYKLAGENYTKEDALSSDYQDNEFQAGTTGNRMQTIEEIFEQQRREKLKQKLNRALLRHLEYDQETDNSLIKINVDLKKEEDKTIFSYALICLGKGFNYDELKSVFSHISEFEKRFPYVADKFHKNVDDNAILKLRAGLLKAVLLLDGKIKKSKRFDEDKDVGTITIPKGGLISIESYEDCKSNDSDNKSDCAYVVDEMGRVHFSDNRIRNTISDIISKPSPIQSNSSIIDEDNLKEKRERLKEKLLSGEYINLKPKSDITDSDSLLRIPGGVNI